MGEMPTPAAPGAAPVLVETAANAAERSLTVADRSRRARCNSVLADVNPATSARDFAKSPRAMSQDAANKTAMRPGAARPGEQGHNRRAARAGGGGNSNVGAGIESRTSLAM